MTEDEDYNICKTIAVKLVAEVDSDYSNNYMNGSLYGFISIALMRIGISISPYPIYVNFLVNTVIIGFYSGFLFSVLYLIEGADKDIGIFDVFLSTGLLFGFSGSLLLYYQGKIRGLVSWYEIRTKFLFKYKWLKNMFITSPVCAISDIEGKTPLNLTAQGVIFFVNIFIERGDVFRVSVNDVDYFIWRGSDASENSSIDKVRQYFLTREMGELSDVVSYTGLSSDICLAILQYFIFEGDLSILVERPILYKWTHDIDFSEGVETVHLEIE